MWMVAEPEVVGRATWAEWPGRPVSHIQSEVEGGRKGCFDSPSNHRGSINEASTFSWFPKLGKKQHVQQIDERNGSDQLKSKEDVLSLNMQIFIQKKTRTLMNECETPEWN